MKDIAFTFGIISNTEKSENRLSAILSSIKNLNIPKYEVIIVGELKHIDSIVASMAGLGMQMPIKVIDFNERIKNAWITKKKNLITQHAQYDNVVYQHDYMAYQPDWYKAWQEYGDNYHAAMNQIINVDGTRYRDWSLFHSNHFQGAKAYSGAQPQECLLPYAETSLSRWMYFSGAYFVAKKHVMQEFPLNENLVWGQGEDCEWSYAVRQKYDFSFVPAKIQMLKYNHPIFHEVRPEILSKIKEYARMQDERKI